MSIYASPPAATKASFREGDVHQGVAAIQRTLLQIGSPLEEDGSFGPETTTAVKAYQRNRGLTADGVAGPATQHRMADGWIADARKSWLLPERILDGQIAGESGWLIAAVGSASPGGLDLSFMQRRVYGPPWDEAAVARAFDAKYQVRLSARTLRERYERFLTSPGVTGPKLLAFIPTRPERAWRLALAYHNYPAGADAFAASPQPSAYWLTAQPWVERYGYRFADGELLHTPFDWLCRYSLGSPVHDEPGQVAKFVTDWTP